MMMLECFSWAVNNNADGDLTHGWTEIVSTAPHAPCDGPSIRYSPMDSFYYVLTGGHTVSLLRTKDFRSWAESTPHPFLSATPPDAQVANHSNFPHRATTVGSPPARCVGCGPDPSLPFRPFVPYWRDNQVAWDHNANDADICCMHPDVKHAYVIWGASTQGGSPSPPLDGKDAGVNAVAVSPMPLGKMLAAYFP
jgi:hypothetical protein